MRVLLVNPPPFQIAEPYYDTPNFPRTGIAYLAGYLREKNIDVHVMDCKLDRLSYADAMNEVKKLQPDLVGLTAFTNEIKPAARFAREVKAIDSNIATMIGGVHVTAIPGDTLREFPEFDYGAVGEGEETLYEFVTHFGDEDALAKVPGVIFLNPEGQFISGGERIRIVDQDTIPMPAWDLFSPAEEYLLHTSRGCPFKCEFCMNPNGRIVRPRTPENVLRELVWLVENQPQMKSILFGDEIFTVKRQRVMEICQGIIDRGFHNKFNWWCETHVRCIDAELVQLMKKAGCNLVGLGVETGDEELLKSLGKSTNKKMILKAVNIMKEAKLDFMTFFIIGHPNETYESIKNTIKFAIELNPSRPIFGIMVPYPGTKIAEMARKGEGGYVLQSHDWNDYNKQLGNALAFKNISRAQMERAQFFGYLEVFIYNFRFVDLAKFVWQYKSEGIAVVKKQAHSFFIGNRLSSSWER